MGKNALALFGALGMSVLLTSTTLAGAMFNNDMSGSKMAVEKVCSPPAVFIGVEYGDLQNDDAMDAASAICYSDQRGEFTIPNSDFGDRARIQVKCDRRTEYVWGIAYKDREGKDEADGVAVICRNKQTGDQRMVESQDLAGGRAHVTITGQNAIGISCNDRQGSDATDGCTLVTK